MPVSQLPQAPYRQDRKLFPTPLTTDVLFSEIRDCNRTEFPEYGTPHPNATKWPHHKLIFIKPVDIERNEIFEFFYAADRESQDLYNFASGYRSLVGVREFRVVQREYVTPRAEFDPLFPAFGASMPDIPSGAFDGVEYVFYDKVQKKIDQPELDSLYVAEVRTYIEVAFLEFKTSYSAQTPDLIPDKFRSGLVRITSEGIVEGLASTPTLYANQLAASEDQINPNVKLVKTTTQPKPSSNITLIGSRSYVETTNATTEETYSSGSLTADTGLLIAQSIVTPLGDGGSVKETVKVSSWPTLVSSTWDPTLNVQVQSTEKFIAPSDAVFTDANTSYRAVNKDRSLKIVETPPADALDNYVLSFPSRLDITLPSVLKRLAVVWSEDIGQGSTDGEWDGQASGKSYSLNGSEGDKCESSATIKPELIIDIEKPWGSDIPVTIYAFFIKTDKGSVTEEALISRVKAVIGAKDISTWPVFKPVGHTIILRGSKASVAASASGNASRSVSESTSMAERGTSKSTSYDVGIDLSAVNLPPTIHGAISLGTTIKKVTVKASAKAQWTGTNFPSLNVSSSARKQIIAAVMPSALAATSPDKIPESGLYIMRTSVEPYKWGYAKCSAIILDAVNLSNTASAAPEKLPVA